MAAVLKMNSPRMADSQAHEKQKKKEREGLDEVAVQKQ